MKKIPLGGKNGKGKFALVDDDDFDLVSKFRWHLHISNCGKQYVMTKRNSLSQYCKTTKDNRGFLHHLVFRYKGKDDIDHINRNGLDNRKSNLRSCTRSENNANSKLHRDNKSGYRGVHWHKQNKTWRAAIGSRDNCKFLGYFKDIKEAAIAYNYAAKQRYGEFANLNDVDK